MTTGSITEIGRLSFSSFLENEKNTRVDKYIDQRISHHNGMIHSLIFKEFIEHYRKDKFPTLTLISSLRRYLGNIRTETDHIAQNVDSGIKRNERDESEDLEKCKEMKKALISVLVCIYDESILVNPNKEESIEKTVATMIIAYELAIWSKIEKNYHRTLDILDALININSLRKKEIINFFQSNSITHPLACFNNPLIFIELQWNLTQSRIGRNETKMRFESLTQSESVDFKLLLDGLNKLLLPPGRSDTNNENKGYEDRYAIFMYVLFRRYFSEQMLEKNNLSTWKTIFDRIETNLKLKKRLDHYFETEIKDGTSLKECENTSQVKRLMSEEYHKFYSELSNPQSSRFEPFSKSLLELIGDISINNPLASKQSNSHRFMSAIVYFTESGEGLDLDLLLNKEQFQTRQILRKNTAGRINRANIFSDAVFMNMLRVEKMKNIPDGIIKSINKEMGEDGFTELQYSSLGGMIQGTIGQVIHTLQPCKPEQLDFKGFDRFPKNTQSVFQHKDFKQYFTESRFIKWFNTAAYLTQAYKGFTFIYIDANGKHQVTRTSKKDRLNILAKGLMQIYSILEDYSSKRNKQLFTSKGKYKSEFLSSVDSHQLIVLPSEKGKKNTNFESELAKLRYMIPFLVYRLSELIKIHSDIVRMKDDIALELPFKNKLNPILEKYGYMIYLELMMIEEFLEEEAANKIDYSFANELLIRLKEDHENHSKSIHKPLEVEVEYVNCLDYKVNEILATTKDLIFNIKNIIKIDETHTIPSLFNRLAEKIFQKNGDYHPTKSMTSRLVSAKIASQVKINDSLEYQDEK